MIGSDHALSVTKQAEAAGIARSTVYYLPRPVSAADLELMRQIGRLRQRAGCTCLDQAVPRSLQSPPPHSSFDGMTPDQAYYGVHSLPPVRLAA